VSLFITVALVYFTFHAVQPMAWRLVVLHATVIHNNKAQRFQACFNVCTGDIGFSWYLSVLLSVILISSVIEDAPATGALHSFRAHVADGKIYVTADPARSLKDNMSRAPRPVDTSNESSGKGVVIVGGGSGAFYATQSMREVSLRIVMVVMRLTDNLTDVAWIQGTDHHSYQGEPCAN